MRCLKLDLGRHASLVGLNPATEANAPKVASFKPWELVIWHRRNQVIPARCAEFEKSLRHLRTYRVLPRIVATSIAFTITVKACHRVDATFDQFGT